MIVSLKDGIEGNADKKHAAEAFVNFLSMPESAVLFELVSLRMLISLLLLVSLRMLISLLLKLYLLLLEHQLLL